MAAELIQAQQEARRAKARRVACALIVVLAPVAFALGAVIGASH
jgi:hypothetical protein